MSQSLPIYDLDEEIIETLMRGNRLILQAPTGSGKSTQVPQILLDGGALGSGQCIILQPRRLAARMLAARVAEERGVRLGGEVGYRIRLDNVSSRDTRILFVTEGILLRQMLADPTLAGVSNPRKTPFGNLHRRPSRRTSIKRRAMFWFSCPVLMRSNARYGSCRGDLGVVVIFFRCMAS